MWTGLASFFSAVAEAFGLISGRSVLRNAADVKAAAIAADEQAEVDKETTATAKQDLDKTREQLSE